MKNSKTSLRLDLADIQDIYTTIIENYEILLSMEEKDVIRFNEMLHSLVLLFIDCSDRFRKRKSISEADKEFLKLAIPKVKKIFYVLEKRLNISETSTNPLPDQDVIITHSTVKARKLENIGHRVFVVKNLESKSKVRRFRVDNYSVNLLDAANRQNPLPSPEMIVTRSKTLATKLEKLGHPVLLADS